MMKGGLNSRSFGTGESLPVIACTDPGPPKTHFSNDFNIPLTGLFYLLDKEDRYWKDRIVTIIRSINENDLFCA
jgi:hypothetical protein